MELDDDDFMNVWMNLSEDERHEIRYQIDRRYNLVEDPTAGHLALRLDQMMVQTPALEVIDKELLGIRDALDVMFARRTRFSELVRSGVQHRYAVQRVMDEIPSAGITRLIISMPPQEGKSSRVSRYGMEWLLRQFPTLRVAIVSYDGGNAGQFSGQIRTDIETFDGESEEVDLRLRLKRFEKAKGRWTLESNGSVYAIGIGGGFTGRPVDLLNIDDPVKDAKAADSLVMSEGAWDWFQTVGKPRVAPWAPIIITMTRWHEYDLAGRLQTKQAEDEALGMTNIDKWSVINIPAQADHEKGLDQLGRKPGEYLISARGRTDDDWETLKNGMSSRHWFALYQGKPSPDAGTIFKKEWWQFYDQALLSNQLDGSFRIDSGYVIDQSWDFTFKESDSTDFVVGQVWARKGADVFLLYQVRARMEFTDCVLAMQRVTALFPQARRKYVEDTANGPAIISSLRHQIPGIIPVSVKGSKPARARAVSHYVEAGNVHLPTSRVVAIHPALSWSVADFMAEVTMFDNAAHDDQVDALTQYLKKTFLDGGEASLTVPRRPTRVAKQDDKDLTPMQKRLAEKQRLKELA